MICSRQMKAVQGRVAQLYYTHGLFCASHPLPIICGVICLALLACYPLTNLPLPGNAPVEVNTPIKDYILPTPPGHSDDPIKQRWYLSQPVAYVQQVVVKTTVSPWERSHMIPTDAVRGPLAKVFQVLNHIQNFKITDRQNKISIDDVCLRVGDVVSNKRLRRFFPEFNCLIVSPANFWHSDMKSFALDGDELKTVNRMYGQPLETSPTLQDLLFGVPWKKTGMSGYFLRNRRRTITYAVTILYKTFSPRFTAGLQESLEIAFPEKWASVNQTDIDYLVHVLYKDVNYFVEYTPLLVIYLLLLLYLYFSVRKIEMVKSKWGLAISAVATVIASLFMSVSICTVFGLTPTLNGGEIFPYLVVIIGLENVLVLTKSVVSTPVHLDVKYRVAQGLSKEGWSITKNLVAELLILLIGFFTFVPAIQEFCAFAVVGLLSDFFLQLVFFATVLSVDIRRMELSDLQRQSVQQEMSVEELSFPVIEPLIRCPVRTRLHSGDAPVTGSLKRSRSAPGLDFVDSVDASPPHDVTSCQGWSPSHLQEVDDPLFPSPAILPRRLRFLYFWARTRMFQRAIMVCTIIWIGLIMYKAGLVEKLAAASESLSDPGGGSPANGMESGGKGARQMGSQGGFNGGFPGSGGGHWMSERDVESQQSLPREEETGPEHSDLETWRHLSFKHWRTLLRNYNISLSGRHISILPSVHLSITVTPEEALKLRHPDKSHKETVNNQAPGSPEAIQQRPSTPSQTPGENGHPTPAIEFYYPQGLKEFTITVVLALLSVFLLLYFMVILYKCCCSRNYDKWRSSWSKKSKRAKGKYFRELRDSLPIILKGHMLDIECLCTDGPLVVSSCLGGQLRVWDSNSGECLTIIQRRGVTPPMKRKPCVGRNVEDSDADLYAEFHGEDASDEEEMLQFGARNRSKSEDEPEGSQLMLDNLASRSRHSLGSSLPLTPFLTAEGENGVTGLSRRRVRAFSERPSGDRSGEATRDRSWSTGSGLLSSTEQADLPAGEQWTAPSIWCLACQDNLIISGCGNGRIEFWDGLTGVLRYLYDDYKVGVTCLCVNGNRVMAARLGGEIDFLELETFQNPAKSLVQQTTTLHNRGGHIRNSSGPGESLTTAKHWEEIIRYNLLERYHGHQQPINCLKSVGGRVVSASIDHTLKVFRVEDCACLYTLHGHLGSVTALYLDKIPPYAAISGSEDGKVRLWDLVTGACVHQMEGQSGMITSLVGTSQFVISCGQDNVLCVWERSHGQLVHRIHNDVCGFTSLAMMFSNILVTGGEGCVCLWDVNKGEMVRRVGVGSPYRPASINYVQLINNTTVICDYANQIHVIHFPTVLEKSQ